jgi:hypothetical protein
MYRNHVALNPLLKKSHVHTEKEESVDDMIEEGIDEYYDMYQEYLEYHKDGNERMICGRIMRINPTSFEPPELFLVNLNFKTEKDIIDYCSDLNLTRPNYYHYWETTQ